MKPPRWLAGFGRRKNLGQTPPAPDIWHWLRQAGGIRTIVDIGAHTGEFAQFLADYFRPERFLALEPLPDCLPALRARAKTIRNLEVLPFAAGLKPGPATIHKNPYPPASSLLPLTEISRREFPQTDGLEENIEVEVRPLDSLIQTTDLPRNILVKIDVQGMEDQVLRGGRYLFGAAHVVLVEMCFAPFYEGQPLFEEIHELLVQMGFRQGGMRNQILSPRTGQPLFCHAIYIRARA
ncbi:FkbM family methyltransferase [bacterium]|nr:FkbM family methyltransferase [bacterium]